MTAYYIRHPRADRLYSLFIKVGEVMLVDKLLGVSVNKGKQVVDFDSFAFHKRSRRRVVGYYIGVVEGGITGSYGGGGGENYVGAGLSHFFKCQGKIARVLVYRGKIACGSVGMGNIPKSVVEMYYIGGPEELYPFVYVKQGILGKAAVVGRAR